jgi:SAM-dependent methyltransferase
VNNHEFCAQWVVDHGQSREVRALDYGCGAGEVIRLLRDRGIHAFGCDSFYAGGDHYPSLHRELTEGGIISRIKGDRLPYDDAQFDLIVNNQVMEHVQDLDRVLAEIARVHKPGGLILSVFPDKQVWREGHCGVPFLHWFAKGSRPRVYYAAAWRLLGFGYYKGKKGRMQWSEEFCRWLDEWTHYRARRDIELSYDKHYSDIQYIEECWLRLRLGSAAWLTAALPRWVQKVMVRKLAGMVFVARRRP